MDATNSIPLEGLNLSVRSYNSLKRAQINNVEDLLNFPHEDLLKLKIKEFGSKSAEEVIIDLLQAHLGITLPVDKASKDT
jgi:DNA-directed RNA polymerase subunit alpha